VVEHRIGADDRRSLDHAGPHLRAALDHDAAVDPAAVVHLAVDGRLEHFEHKPVRGEDVAHPAGVDPVILDGTGIDPPAAVEQSLDRLGDFEFAPRRRLQCGDDFMHRRLKHVEADDREIARRNLWLFDQPLQATVRREYGDAELLGTRHPHELHLRGWSVA
jgi:hypothetical protein